MDFNLDEQRILPGDIEVAEEKSKGIFPRFYIETVQNNFKSNEAGRAIFDEVEYVEITIAGDRNSKIQRKVTDIDKKRFATAYNRFKEGLEPATSGTAVEQWPMISRGQAEEMKHMGIHTVEALAELSDTAIQQMGMGYRALVEKAKAFLAVANETADVTHLATENHELKSKVGVLEQQVADLSAHMQNYEALVAKVQALEIENANTAPAQQIGMPPPVTYEAPPTPEPEPEVQSYDGMTKLQLKSLLDIRGVTYKQRDSIETLKQLAQESDNAL